jgi:FkbH-like protein
MSTSPSPLQRRLAWKKIRLALPPGTPKIAILSTFTANPLEALLGSALHDEGVYGHVSVGPYDQILPECLMPGSETDSLRPDMLVVWPRIEDLWRALPVPLVDDLDAYVSALVDLALVAQGAAAKWSASLLFVLPAHPEFRPIGVGDALNPLGVTAAWEAARIETRRALSDAPGTLVADADQVVRRLGSDSALDPRTMTAARVPYSDAMFSLMADDIARLIRLHRFGAKKLAIVDADNTLWGGVVGEDGVDGIDLLDNGQGEAFREFQRWLLELRRSGMVLALASKNNEAELWEAFGRREMNLRQEDLAAWRVNWQPKPLNIVEIVDELNLGLASVVFIDDSPIELTQVSDALPEVATVQMPEDASFWSREIARSGLLDRLPPTREDLRRAESYTAESERRMVREQMTPDQYLKSLSIEVHFMTATDSDLGRLAQLVAKTNQFTLGGVRHDEATLLSMVHDPGFRVRLVSVIDRFGDYGIVGATIMRFDSQPASLDTFVLSCRAMGRGVEEAMVADACAAANQELTVVVHETPRNVPGRTFFASLGIEPGHVGTLHNISWPSHVGSATGDGIGDGIGEGTTQSSVRMGDTL